MQGLLSIQAPEPRSELVCTRKDCMIIFWTVQDIIKHRIENHLSKGKGFNNTIEENHAMQIRWFKQFTLPPRPTRRWNVTQAEMDNRKKRKCHCGKDKSQWDSKYRRLYCSDKCSEDWNSKTTFWNDYRYRILKEHAVQVGIGMYGRIIYRQTCEHCGTQRDSLDEHWNVDHIIAIMNGGHAWHKDNLQVLCEDCHKIKTKSDHEYRRDLELENSVMILESDSIDHQDTKQTKLLV